MSGDRIAGAVYPLLLLFGVVVLFTLLIKDARRERRANDRKKEGS